MGGGTASMRSAGSAGFEPAPAAAWAIPRRKLRRLSTSGASAGAARGRRFRREERSRDVALAGVGENHDDALAAGLVAGRDLHRGPQRRSAGAAGEDALARGDQAGGVERVLVVHGDGLVEQLAVEDRGNEARADALDLVRAGEAA